MAKILTICLVLLAGNASPAQALPPASKTLAALLLARTCVKEAGWNITDDCVSIHAVVQKRADMEKHTYYEQMLERYSRVASNRMWLEQLDLQGSKPEAWPQGAHWEKHRGKWLQILAHATEIVEGRVQAPCKPDHWGDSRGDHKRAVLAGWTQIECGQSLNEFWRVKAAE
jgi:hypothetical protein